MQSISSFVKEVRNTEGSSELETEAPASNMRRIGCSDHGGFSEVSCLHAPVSSEEVGHTWQVGSPGCPPYFPATTFGEISSTNLIQLCRCRLLRCQPHHPMDPTTKSIAPPQSAAPAAPTKPEALPVGHQPRHSHDPRGQHESQKQHVARFQGHPPVVWQT